MSKLVDLAAVDFRFFRAFIDGDDNMYEKFVKNCPSESMSYGNIIMDLALPVLLVGKN